ncbi:MAG: thioredoxin family protein [Nannocystaceae bacterium]
MTRVGLALALVLGGCPREDASVAATTSATPTPPTTPSGTTATPTPTATPGETAATPTPPAPSDPDAVRIVEIDPQAGTLQEQLIAAAARAHADGRPIALELWAGWCAPCKKLDAMLRDGAVARRAARRGCPRRRRRVRRGASTRWVSSRRRSRACIGSTSVAAPAASRCRAATGAGAMPAPSRPRLLLLAG